MVRESEKDDVFSTLEFELSIFEYGISNLTSDDRHTDYPAEFEQAHNNPLIGMLASRSVAVAASRQVARRNLSTTPKMHKLGDHWQTLASKRPVQHDELHVRY